MNSFEPMTLYLSLVDIFRSCRSFNVTSPDHPGIFVSAAFHNGEFIGADVPVDLVTEQLGLLSSFICSRRQSSAAGVFVGLMSAHRLQQAHLAQHPSTDRHGKTSAYGKFPVLSHEEQAKRHFDGCLELQISHPRAPKHIGWSAGRLVGL